MKRLITKDRAWLGSLAGSLLGFDNELSRTGFEPESPFHDSPEANGGDDDRRQYRAIWISDTHLGTKGCQSELLVDFLRSTESEYLYLVGDIIDGWSIRRSWYWNEDHNTILQTILEKSRTGTKVVYVCGNHDEFLRDYVGVRFGGVSVRDEAVHTLLDGRRLLVLHGDKFDVCLRTAKWLALLGDRAYQVCLKLNTWLNFARRHLGLGYWSLSSYLKQKVKNAVSYVEDFEEAVIDEASRRGYDGVVCGHIHQAQVRESDGVLYCNDGDWVESCSALVEDSVGRVSILRWSEELQTRRRAELAAVS